MEKSWSIERLVPGGDGMARLSDGRVAFASGVCPGDRIEVAEVASHASYVRAVHWELGEPGPDRVSPPCRWAGRCGGCDWMQLGRPAQVAAKASIIGEALRRTAKLEPPRPVVVESRGPDAGYRNRLTLHVAASGAVGLFAERSHELVEIPSCYVSDAAIQAALGRLRELPADARAELGRYDQVELRVAPGGPPLFLVLSPRVRRRPAEVAAVLRDALPADWKLIERGAEVDAASDQLWPLPRGCELHVPPGAFVQVNPEVNRALIEAVLVGVESRGVRSFLELYAGAGNFTLPLLAAGLEGRAVETSGPGVRAARRAARARGLSDDAFRAGDALRELDRFARSKQAVELVLLDPPRTGAKSLMPALRALAPAHVAFVSCDPVTLARDLALLASDYTLDEVTGFDMFPHTHHVESLVFLRRK